MNEPPDLQHTMVGAAFNAWFAKTCVSARQLQQIAAFACTAHQALALIREAAERAVAQNAVMEPSSLLAFLTENGLMLTEIHNGQDSQQDQDQGLEPARAADH